MARGDEAAGDFSLRLAGPVYLRGLRPVQSPESPRTGVSRFMADAEAIINAALIQHISRRRENKRFWCALGGKLVGDDVRGVLEHGEGRACISPSRTEDSARRVSRVGIDRQELHILRGVLALQVVQYRHVRVTYWAFDADEHDHDGPLLALPAERPIFAVDIFEGEAADFARLRSGRLVAGVQSESKKQRRQHQQSGGGEDKTSHWGNLEKGRKQFAVPADW